MVEKDDVLAIAKSIAATAIVFVVLYFIVDIINQILLGDITIGVKDILMLTRPEVSFIITAVVVFLGSFMIWTLRK
ncbi:MAG: hypothetical protein ACE5J7_03855 [Candidatus Aenigmatarchaeota archaeon]